MNGAYYDTNLADARQVVETQATTGPAAATAIGSQQIRTLPQPEIDSNSVFALTALVNARMICAAKT
jgi:hypothetical protein